MKTALGALCAVLAVSACSSAPRERIVPQPVRVPVPVACAAQVPPAPSYAADLVDLDSDIRELSKALLIDRLERKAHEERLVAALTGCIGS